MTAHDLIRDIFSRAPRLGMESNVRRITPAQLSFLRDLIGADPEGAALQRASASSQIWMPSGRDKYLVTEDLKGDRHTIARLMNLKASGAGMLF